MANTEFVEQYEDLIIKQFWSKTNARAEIRAGIEQFEKIYQLFLGFSTNFNLDIAWGDRLDIIGTWVGLNRVVPSVLPKTYFGFAGVPNTRGFADLNDASILSAPFLDLTEPTRTDLELNDNDYRWYLRAQIARNSCHAVMKNMLGTSIQDVVRILFNNRAYVLDTQEMRLVLYIFGEADLFKVKLLRLLDLLPHSQGVGYDIINIPAKPYFGFAGDPLAAGFSDLSDPAVIGGTFASVIR